MDRVDYTVYTFGCANKKIQELEGEVYRLGATIVDIREKPYGLNKVFNRSELQDRFGARYVWIIEFGTKNYQSGKAVEFADAELGARKLGSITADGTPVILLCACENLRECHRDDLAKKLNEECGWKICHLPYVESVETDGYLFPCD